jgi:hypothetical protein
MALGCCIAIRVSACLACDRARLMPRALGAVDCNKLCRIAKHYSWLTVRVMTSRRSRDEVRFNVVLVVKQPMAGCAGL